MPGKLYFSINSEAKWQNHSLSQFGLQLVHSNIKNTVSSGFFDLGYIIDLRIFAISENVLVCFWEPEDNKIIIETPKFLVKNLAAVSHHAGSQTLGLQTLAEQLCSYHGQANAFNSSEKPLLWYC